ncbi:MAG: sulfurtransferase [Candidatus Thioglobus sp.]|nr:MAG: sulfurtransferase [Candidatus Thioglobus sp.]
MCVYQIVYVIINLSSVKAILAHLSLFKKGIIVSRYLLFISLIFSAINPALADSGVHVEITDGNKMLETVNKEIVNINTQQLKEILDKDPSAILIDVRTRDEIVQLGTIRRGHNHNIVRGWLEFQIGEHALSKDTPIIVYCGLNLRSPLATKTLMDMGYTNVKNYADGYFKWKEAGLPVTVSDKSLKNALYSLPIKVAEGVYSAIGATQPTTYENGNHNNNLSFVVTTDGVLVFNAGGSYLLAEAMHEEIKKVTDQPVKHVVFENAQGHAILGAKYWKDHNVNIIAHELTLKEIVENGDNILSRADRRLRDKIVGSVITHPDQTFKDGLTITMGDTVIELLHLGASHSPDDVQLWLPAQKLLISGDSTFNERLLPILKHTDSQGWIETWDKIEALEPNIIIPGHGAPTDLATTTKFTKDYLVYMRSEIEKVLDDDGGLNDAYAIDQSQYHDWDTYNELYRQNASRLFKQMEFE